LFTDMAMRRSAPRIANPACDRQTIWAGADPCPAFTGPAGTSAIAGTGVWVGPLWVLIDRGTASAAEEFAGWLSDNRVALLVGQTSYGAGCGYVNGGAPVALRAAQLTLRMPNCARFAADGRNEIEGWRPDIPLPDPRSDAQGWANGLRRALAP
jgi:C-terminal processing protease CtpA/Prc